MSTSSSARTTITSATGTSIRSRLRRSEKFIPAPTTTLPAPRAFSNSRACWLPAKGQLQRGILFADFAGEELGLLGSAEWVKEPTLPLDKAVAMINMDMIGRIKDEKVFIGGTGTGATFKDLLDEEKSKSPIPYRIFRQRLCGERSHLVCRKENSGALLFLGLALGLSQAFRHLGQNQCARCGEAFGFHR